MNIVVVNVFKRPLHTRLCLEAIARAQRWSGGWADRIAVVEACNAHEHPKVAEEIEAVIARNQDLNWCRWQATSDVPSSPHAMSKWMLDRAFDAGADMAVYVEDDAILSPDAFLMCEMTKRADAFYRAPCFEDHSIEKECISEKLSGRVLGCCLYHETIPEQYVREGRPEGPDRTLLHLGNGLNTCGGTAFLREPYLKYLSPEWNCKQVEPRGFDYSAHYLMYRHGLYMVWPDWSRSINLGFEHGSLSPESWRQYFGKSLYVQTAQSVRDWQEFRVDGVVPPLVREEWMTAELQHRGIE